MERVQREHYLVWPFLVYRIKRLQTLITFSLITRAAILILRIVLVALRSCSTTSISPTFSCADRPYV